MPGGMRSEVHVTMHALLGAPSSRAAQEVPAPADAYRHRRRPGALHALQQRQGHPAAGARVRACMC